MMQLSDQGINLIKEFEGLRLKAYKDSAGVWTIGYGSTRYADESSVKPGDTLADEQQASALFINTLTPYERSVNSHVKVPLNQNQFDSLVSLTYNVGEGIMQSSTLIKKLNAKDYIRAADQFLAWDKVTHPVTHLKGVSYILMERREKERELFLKPI